MVRRIDGSMLRALISATFLALLPLSGLLPQAAAHEAQ
jgi:hypothetical protein